MLRQNSTALVMIFHQWTEKKKHLVTSQGKPVGVGKTAKHPSLYVPLQSQHGRHTGTDLWLMPR